MLFVCLLLAISATAYAQRQYVSGTVTDASGAPAVGVSVVVEGTTFGVITDDQGKYTIEASPGQVLSFYLIGTKSQKVTVSSNVVNVQLEDDSLALDEVVVTAMGITRSEKSLGYAATTVKNEELAGPRASNVTNALAGKVAGMQVSSTTTDPGASVNVVIRGYSSINGSNQPLYVVDGIVVGGMSNIPSDDIETVTVLKGAAATALYGSRAANGVILITTKQGKSGTSRNFSIEYNGGVQARQVSLLPTFQNEFGQGWNGAQTFIENGSWGPRLDGSTQVYGPIWNGSQRIHTYDAKENNIKDFFDIGWSHNHNIAINGASDDQKLTYYLSYSNTSDNGIMPGDHDTYKRNTIAMRSSFTPEKWLKISSQINLALAKRDAVPMFQGASVIDGLLEFPRDISVVDLKDLSSAFNTPEAYYTPYGITNPYWALENTYAHTDQKNIFGKLQADVKPIKDLTLTYRFGFNYTDYDSKMGYPEIALDDALIDNDYGYAPSSMNEAGTVSVTYYRGYEVNHDFLANYMKDFVDGRLSLNATAGLNINERYGTSTSSTASSLTIYSGWWDLSNGSSWDTMSESQSKRRLVGLFGDITLGWDDTFFLDLTARNDWSSTLPIDNNHYFYPGITASWIFTNTLPKNNILSHGKLRVAYGKTGNDAGVYNTNPAYYQSSFRGYYGTGIADFPINGTNAFRRGYSISSDSLKPEMTTEFEIGADLRFLNGRIGLDASYYNRHTKDQIFSVSVDPAVGYTSAVTNAGDVQNKGVELVLNLVPVQTKDWRWDVDINFAKNNSKVISLPEDLGDKMTLYSFSAGNDAVYMYAEVGQPFGTYWTYLPTYVEDTSSPYYDCLIVDEAGQPVLTTEVQSTGMNANYDWTGGLSTSLRYKNISLSAALDIRKGGYMFSRSKNIMQFTGNGIITTYNDRQPFVIPNSVYVDADGNYSENTQPIYLTNSSYQDYFNDYGYGNGGLAYMLDRSFVKLRNVTITYNLPKKILGPFQGASISAFVNNAFTWTASGNYYVDPESTNITSSDQSMLFGETYVNPSCRIWGFNLNVKF